MNSTWPGGESVLAEFAFEQLDIVVLGFLAGLLFVYRGFTLWRRKRLIQDTPTETVRSMAVGRTELQGVVQPDDLTLSAPFSDAAECVYVHWEVQVWKRRHAFSNAKSWVTVSEGTEFVPFVLEDDTGRVRVEPHAANPVLDFTEEQETTSTLEADEDPPERLQAFDAGGRTLPEGAVEYTDVGQDPLYRRVFDSLVATLPEYDSSLDPFSSGTERRYVQEILPVGEEVYVFGNATPQAADEAGLSNEAKLAIDEPAETGLFLVSDRDEDGLTDHYSSRGPAYLVLGLVLSAAMLYLLLLVLTG